MSDYQQEQDTIKKKKRFADFLFNDRKSFLSVQSVSFQSCVLWLRSTNLHCGLVTGNRSGSVVGIIETCQKTLRGLKVRKQKPRVTLKIKWVNTFSIFTSSNGKTTS